MAAPVTTLTLHARPGPDRQSTDLPCRCNDRAYFQAVCQNRILDKEKQRRPLWSGAAFVRSYVRSDAAEKVGQCENSRKTDHCAGGNAPAGLLYGLIHDHSGDKTVIQAASSIWTRSAQDRVFNDVIIISQLQKRQFCDHIIMPALAFLHGFTKNQLVAPL